MQNIEWKPIKDYENLCVNQHKLEGVIHAKDIEDELKLNANNIRQCCRGNRKSVGGYKWEYMI